MPLCTLLLLSLHTDVPNPLRLFLSTLRLATISPLVIARVIRWIILPSVLSTDDLLAQNIHWDLLIILPSPTSLPTSLADLVQHQWSITAGIPSRLVQDFEAKNRRLLHPGTVSMPILSSELAKPVVADSAQSLELSPALQSWIHDFSSSHRTEGRGAISMLNLLSFKPGMKSSYLEYGKAFAESIGSKHGGNAKLVGSVINVNGKEKEESEGGWDEIALAHYPSILHFQDMLASDNYQRVNHRFRLPSLKDTFILCTSEIGIEEPKGGEQGEMKSRL